MIRGALSQIKSQRSEFPQQTHIILRLLKQAGTVAQTFAAKDIALFFKAIAILQHYPDPHLLQALSKRRDSRSCATHPNQRGTSPRRPPRVPARPRAVVPGERDPIDFP